jgi:hypothetical protein
MTMNDNGRFFPNILQPAATLKAYAPMGVKFWENQETALKDLKEFADGWFARRQKGMHAALEAAQHLGDAGSPADMLRDTRTGSRERWNCLRRMGKPISNRCRGPEFT